MRFDWFVCMSEQQILWRASSFQSSRMFFLVLGIWRRSQSTGQSDGGPHWLRLDQSVSGVCSLGFNHISIYFSKRSRGSPNRPRLCPRPFWASPRAIWPGGLCLSNTTWFLSIIWLMRSKCDANGLENMSNWRSGLRRN